YLTFSPLPRWSPGRLFSVALSVTAESGTRLLTGVLPCTVRTFLGSAQQGHDSTIYGKYKDSSKPVRIDSFKTGTLMPGDELTPLQHNHKRSQVVCHCR